MIGQSHAPVIAILSGIHLCQNPRVLKQGVALGRAGYAVTIFGGYYDVALKARDEGLLKAAPFRYVPVVDMTGGGMGNFFSRARTKAGRLLNQGLGIETRWQLGHAYAPLKLAALRENADLYLCHLEPALAVAADLHRGGKRVAIDVEDWYSQDLLPEARRQRPLRLLHRLEHDLLKKSAFSLCTSHAMAGALAAAYACRPPHVIYNSFPWRDRATLDGQIKDRRNGERPSLCWVSQTIGPGRGLDDLFEALKRVPHDAEIHLRGKLAAGFSDWLAARAPAAWRGRIFLHEPASNSELLSRIAEHDIGFAGEQPYCRNKDLTVSNKVFHYMLGGLAVLASDTIGQREIAAASPGAIRLYRACDPISLAAALNDLLESPKRLQAAKTAALRAAQEKFCWEIEEPRLLRLVSESLHSSMGPRSEAGSQHRAPIH